MIDPDGSPLVGASVTVSGTGRGISTGVNGSFTIAAPDGNSTIRIAFLGMETVEIPVSSVTGPLNIRMTYLENTMEEVIVTGYGTIQKSAYAGSASSVNTEMLKDVPNLSLNDMLRGTAPGVDVSTQSSQPGAAQTIRIRGLGSINGSNAPLYVVDGIVVMSGNIGSSDSAAGLDAMASINPSDIANITIIKDAAAASLYGSRASNGVVLITTKKGQKGKAQVSAKINLGFTDLAMLYRDNMKGEERRATYYEGYINAYEGNPGNYPNYSSATAYADAMIDNIAPKPWDYKAQEYRYTDWSKELFQTGSFQNYDLSLSGGSDNIRYYTSLSYTDQEGNVKKSSAFDRITGRVNLEANVSKRIIVGVNSQFSTIHQDVFREGTTYVSPYYSSRKNVTPSDPVYNEDGSWNESLIYDNQRYNPLQALTYSYRKQAQKRAFNTIFAQYEILTDLKFRTTLSHDFMYTKWESWNDPRTSDGLSSNGALEASIRERMKTVWSNTLSYRKKIGKHDFDALVAHDAEMFRTNSVSAESRNFLDPDYNVLSNGSVPYSVSGYPQEWRMASVITRFNYNYSNKYYFGASFRNDRSSRLAPDGRSANFWSVSGAWRVSGEEFMASVQNVLSDLRLRVSYGKNGNQPSDYYDYFPLTSLSTQYMQSPGTSLYSVANYSLTWEKNANLNIGLDFGLFDRVNFSLEFFNRITSDLLYSEKLSYTTGFSSLLMNIGKMRNRGVELEINSTNINSKNFLWTTTFTISHMKNKILKLGSKETQYTSSPFIREVGRPYSTFYVYKFAGIDPDDGEPMVYLNKELPDGTLDRTTTKSLGSAEYIPYKTADPSSMGGLSNAFYYKGFDLNFLLTYQFGGYTYDQSAEKLEHGGAVLVTNIPTYYRDRWQQPGDVTQYEKFDNSRSSSRSMASHRTSRRVHSSDFIKLKNITFGYTIPKNLTQKIGLSSVRVYASGTNVWTLLSAWKGYDPESASSTGLVHWNQPPLRTVTFSIDLKF